MRVLVVDDETLSRKVIIALLSTRDDYVCEGFEDPRDALARLADHEYDLILTDYRMPSMNGLEFIDRIRQSDTAAPIVMITAHAEPSLVKGALSRGANALIAKPVRAQELFSVIDGLLPQAN